MPQEPCLVAEHEPIDIAGSVSTGTTVQADWSLNGIRRFRDTIDNLREGGG